MKDPFLALNTVDDIFVCSGEFLIDLYFSPVAVTENYVMFFK
jgi:hypothetical protein